MILCLISLRYFDQDLSRCLASTKDSKSRFRAARVDSRARTSRLHQVLKRNLTRWIKIWIKSRRRRRFSRENFQKTCVKFVSVKICF